MSHWTAEDIERFADGELVDAAIEGHVRECASCAARTVDVMRMKRAIARLPRHAPRAMRPAVTPRSPWWIAIAAAIVLVSGSYFAAARSAARELVDLHTTIVGSASPVDVISTDKHTVKPWFEGRVPFAVDVPDLQSTPFRLAGGRVVFWRGEPVAYLLVNKGAHRLSVFVSRSAIAPRFARTPMTIVSWSRGDLTYTAIGDLSAADLRSLRDAFTSQP